MRTAQTQLGLCFERQAPEQLSLLPQSSNLLGLNETANAHPLVQVLNLPELEVAVMYSGVHHGLEVLCEELGIFVLQGDRG